MKFQKYLSSVEQSFRFSPLMETCIPYKKWKKVIKYHMYPWSLKDLEHQCQTVEYVFYKSMKAYHDQTNNQDIPNKTNKHSGTLIRHLSSFGFGFGCCKGRVNPYRISPEHTRESLLTPKELIAFAEINTQAVYKVCKKLEKTKEITGAMKFLESLRSSHRYSFMGSNRITHLHLSDPEDPIDRTCPICFEDLGRLSSSEQAPDPSQIAIILPCGHYQCFDCFCRMTPYHRIPATFHNRMRLISPSFRCPICRMCSKDGLVDQISFWPLPPQDIKKSFLPPVLVKP